MRRLGVERNGVFTTANTDPIDGGRLWPPAATTWRAMCAAFVAGGGHPSHFRPGGPASSARSVAQQRGFFAQQPPAAAVPGSSNHGLGIAVDIPFPDAQVWLRANAHRYGWSNAEGARVGEAWHWTFQGVSAVALSRFKRLEDPRRGYTPAEKRWMREFDRNPSAARRRVLIEVMRDQRRRIWVLAQPSPRGDGQGWTATRTKRYRSLKARTT